MNEQESEFLIPTGNVMVSYISDEGTVIYYLQISKMWETETYWF